MAKEDALRSSYIKALRHAGSYYATGIETIEELKKQWNNFRSEYRNRTGNSAPSLYTYAKATTEAIPTIGLGMDYINSFINVAKSIYSNTEAYILSDSDKLSSIACAHPSVSRELAFSVGKIREQIQLYLESGVPPEILAQAISENVEMNYTIAVALNPPSDVKNLFETTLDQLEGIWGQINELIQQRAEEMENEYYGL